MMPQLLVNKIVDQFEYKYRSQTIKVYSGKDMITLTYQDFYRLIHQIGNYLKNNKGDRMGTLCENHEYHLSLSFSISCLEAPTQVRCEAGFNSVSLIILSIV